MLVVSYPSRGYVGFMSKRPTHRPGDTVTLSDHVGVIPEYDDKPAVLRDTVLRVSSVIGTGSKRAPYGVVATDGVHFWHFEPGDLQAV